jgi:anaerobic selenocysteine-containing dehydrogenase
LFRGVGAGWRVRAALSGCLSSLAIGNGVAGRRARAPRITDRAFIDAHTTGFEKTAESVAEWTPGRAAKMAGVAPEAIEKAAHLIEESRRVMFLHARGIEHQSKGVENCEAVLAIALATANIGREGAGPVMITGQGNGQGGVSRQLTVGGLEHSGKASRTPFRASSGNSGMAPSRYNPEAQSGPWILRSAAVGRGKASGKARVNASGGAQLC